MKKEDQRNFSFVEADWPLTSPRVARILGKPEEARKLVTAVKQAKEKKMNGLEEKSRTFIVSNNSPDLEELNSLYFAGFMYERKGISFVKKVIRKAEREYWFSSLRSFYRGALEFKKNYDSKNRFQ